GRSSVGRQAVLTTLARRARTGVLRFVSPIDAALRLALGRRRLPPLWLRRHTGALSAFESAASEMTRFLDRLNPLDGRRRLESRFIGMIEDAGLHLQWHSEGFFPGRNRLTAQDVLLLGH
ncbi:MAG: hypothetical protein WAU32_14305, partial [Thermoanaerobaculia bacterium]